MVAFQPAGDLQPCTRYRAEVTTALVDAQHRPVAPSSWTFRTSGCRGRGHAAVLGTVTCATAAFVASDPSGAGAALARLDGCAGGQDGRTPRGVTLPIATGVGAWSIHFAGGACAAFAPGIGRDDQRQHPVGGRSRARHRSQPDRGPAVRPPRDEGAWSTAGRRCCRARCSRSGSPSTRRRVTRAAPARSSRAPAAAPRPGCPARSEAHDARSRSAPVSSSYSSKRSAHVRPRRCAASSGRIQGSSHRPSASTASRNCRVPGVGALATGTAGRHVPVGGTVGVEVEVPARVDVLEEHHVLRAVGAAPAEVHEVVGVEERVGRDGGRAELLGDEPQRCEAALERIGTCGWWQVAHRSLREVRGCEARDGGRVTRTRVRAEPATRV